MTTILCIDDEAELREEIAEGLEEAGYTVVHANDGIEGLAMIREHDPDLVLSDISMPHKDGFQLLKEIRETYPLFAFMPFIFLSALADEERVLAGLKDGADAYIIKPVDLDVLLAKIEQSLKQAEQIEAEHTEDFVLDI